MIAHELVPAPDPVRCCEQLADLPHRVFLDSAQQGSPLGRYSFLAADPVEVVQGKGAASAGALGRVRALLAPRAATPIPGLPPSTWPSVPRRVSCTIPDRKARTRAWAVGR